MSESIPGHSIADDRGRTRVEQARQRRCLLVLGMHRSGTSAMTRFLSLLGADLPATLMPPVPNNNESGFWESVRFHDYHNDLLSESGTGWNDWRALELEQVPAARRDEIKRNIGALIEDEYGGSRFFVLKDPRICRFLPLYTELLSERGIKPCFVITLRNPLAVAASLSQRDGLTTGFACLVWLGHVLEVEKVTRDGPRVLVEYEKLLSDWRSVAARIGQRLDVIWTNPPERAAPDIEQFLSRSLQHHTPSYAELDAHPEVPLWVKQAYAALLQLQKNPNAQAALTKLDQIRTEFEAVAPIFGEAVHKELVARELIHAEDRRRQWRDAEAALRKQESTIASLNQQVAAHSHQIEELNALLPLRDAKIAALSQELDAQNERIARLDALLALRETRISELSRAVASQKIEATLVQADRDTRLLALERAHVADREQRDAQLQAFERARVTDLRALSAKLAERDYVVGLWQAADVAYRNSKSWRITRPMRAAFRWLQGLAYSPVGYRIVLIVRRLNSRNRAALRDWQAVDAILWSGVFDQDWYRKNNPDVAASGIHPIRHYVCFGASEGRDPSPAFSTRDYLAQNPDVAAAGLNPLVHFVLHGAMEGRSGSGIAASALPAPRLGRRQRLRSLLRRMIFWDRLSFKTRNRLRDQARRVMPRRLFDFLFAVPPLSKQATWRIENDHSVAVPFGYDPLLRRDGIRLAVICHIYFEDITAELQRYLRNIPFPFDLFISTDSRVKQAKIQDLFAEWDRGSVEIRLVPNRGRDIAPKLVGFRDVYDRYEYVLHLHSKSSPHNSALKNWRGFLLENLLGSTKIVESVFAAFTRHPDLGIVSGQHLEIVSRWIDWAGNFEQASRLAGRMGISLSPDGVLDFPAGSMFWARSAALRPLLDLNLSVDDFPPETGQFDGTLAHAIERLYYVVCERAGFRWIKVARPELVTYSRGVTTIDSPEAIDRFIAAKTLKLSDSVVSNRSDSAPGPKSDPATLRPEPSR